MKVNKLVLSLLAAGLSAGILSGAQAADADRIKALEDQLQVLQQAIAELKNSTPTKKEVADLTDQVTLQGKESVVLGDMPNSFRMPGSETSVRIYGFAEVNAIRDTGSVSPDDHFSWLPSQPLNINTPATGMTRVTTQTSRFGFETSTPTALGAFHTVIEADFYAGDNSALRLRHAYGEYAGFLIGQTWSTFMDGDNFPESVDFNGPPGSTSARTVQLRYTHNIPDVATFKFAVERNGSGSSKLNPTNDQPLSLVLRADKTFANGAALSLRAIRHTEIDAGGNSAVGYGLGVSGSFKFTDTLTGFGQFTKIDGDNVGNLVVGTNGARFDTTSGALAFDKTTGVVLGLNNVFNEKWRTTVSYGQSVSDETAVFKGGDNSSLKQWHLGFYYTPIKSVDLGAEYIKGTRTTFDGDTGDLNRFNLQARYSFN
ncbi:MAG: DcaP family trimeric outer membrane transporter [Rhodoferax sp.]|uniref:DcaP family trimeric outer membrane transporter n=1 Tax=Rhodoferax sp. TaxID=50421 RepID=UPI003018336E